MTTQAVRVFQPPRNSENTCARIVKLGTTFWKAEIVHYTNKSNQNQKKFEISSMTSDLPRVIKRLKRLQVGSSWQAGTWRRQQPQINWAISSLANEWDFQTNSYEWMKLPYKEYEGAKTCEWLRLRYESALSVTNSQKQNWRFKLNGCIITAHQSINHRILMHTKQEKWKRPVTIHRWTAHIKKFNHYFSICFTG